MTTVALTDRPNTALRAALEAKHADFAALGVQPKQYVQAALMAVVKEPKLLDCSPESVVLALMQCAQTGLEVGRTAHLMPFGRQCTFVPDYRGYIELAMATGKVDSVRVRAVYEHEDFMYAEEVHGPVLRHVPRAQGAGGKIVGAYAIADMHGGRYKVEFMTAEEIDAIRTTKSKSWKSGPLTDWYARKTVVRRLCKTLPMTPKLHAALRSDDAEPLGEEQGVADGPMLPPNDMDRQLSAGDGGADVLALPSGARRRMTLDEAEGMLLPGNGKAWGGKGGQPLGTLSMSMLESVIKWTDSDAEKQAKFGELALACEIIIGARRDEQGAGADDMEQAA